MTSSKALKVLGYALNVVVVSMVSRKYERYHRLPLLWRGQCSCYTA